MRRLTLLLNGLLLSAISSMCGCDSPMGSRPVYTVTFESPVEQVDCTHDMELDTREAVDVDVVVRLDLMDDRADDLIARLTLPGRASWFLPREARVRADGLITFPAVPLPVATDVEVLVEVFIGGASTAHTEGRMNLAVEMDYSNTECFPQPSLIIGQPVAGITLGPADDANNQLEDGIQILVDVRAEQFPEGRPIDLELLVDGEPTLTGRMGVDVRDFVFADVSLPVLVAGSDGVGLEVRARAGAIDVRERVRVFPEADTCEMTIRFGSRDAPIEPPRDCIDPALVDDEPDEPGTQLTARVNTNCGWVLIEVDGAIAGRFEVVDNEVEHELDLGQGERSLAFTATTTRGPSAREELTLRFDSQGPAIEPRFPEGTLGLRDMVPDPAVPGGFILTLAGVVRDEASAVEPELQVTLVEAVDGVPNSVPIEPGGAFRIPIPLGERVCQRQLTLAASDVCGNRTEWTGSLCADPISPTMRWAVEPARLVIDPLEDLEPGEAGTQIDVPFEVVDPRAQGEVEYLVGMECVHSSPPRPNCIGCTVPTATRFSELAPVADEESTWRGAVRLHLDVGVTGHLDCGFVVEASPNEPLIDRDARLALHVLPRQPIFTVDAPRVGECLADGEIQVRGRGADLAENGAVIEGSLDDGDPFRLVLDGAFYRGSPPDELPDGAYQLTVSGTLVDGSEVVSWPEVVPFRIDTIPPDGETLLVNRPIDIRDGAGTPDDCQRSTLAVDVHDPGVDRVCLRRDGVPDRCAAVDSGQARFEDMILHHGPNRFVATAVDCAGGQGESLEVEWDVVECAPPPPRISWEELPDVVGHADDILLGGDTIDVAMLLTVIGLGGSDVSIVLTDDGGEERIVAELFIRGDEEELRILLSLPLPEGDDRGVRYEVGARAAERDDLEVQPESIFVIPELPGLSVSVTSDPPEPPGGDGNGNCVRTDDIRLAGEAHVYQTLAAPAVVRAIIRCGETEGGSVDGRVEPDGALIFIDPLSPPEDGACVVTVSITDAGGQSASRAVNFVRDRQPPRLLFAPEVVDLQGEPVEGVLEDGITRYTVAVDGQDDIWPDGSQLGSAGVQLEPVVAVEGADGQLYVLPESDLFASLGEDFAPPEDGFFLEGLEVSEVILPIVTLEPDVRRLELRAMDVCQNELHGVVEYHLVAPLEVTVTSPPSGVPVPSERDLAPERDGCQIRLSGDLEHIGSTAEFDVCALGPDGVPDDVREGGCGDSSVLDGGCIVQDDVSARFSCSISLADGAEHRLVVRTRFGDAVHVSAPYRLQTACAPLELTSLAILGPDGVVATGDEAYPCVNRGERIEPLRFSNNAFVDSRLCFSRPVGGGEFALQVGDVTIDGGQAMPGPQQEGADEACYRFRLDLPPGETRLQAMARVRQPDGQGDELEPIGEPFSLHVDTVVPTPTVDVLRDGLCLNADMVGAAESWRMLIDPGQEDGEEVGIEIDWTLDGASLCADLPCEGDIRTDLPGAIAIDLPLREDSAAYRLGVQVSDDCGNVGMPSGFASVGISLTVDRSVPIIGAEPTPTRGAEDDQDAEAVGFQMDVAVSIEDGGERRQWSEDDGSILFLDGSRQPLAPRRGDIAGVARLTVGPQQTVHIEWTDTCGNVGTARLPIAMDLPCDVRFVREGFDEEGFDWVFGLRDGRHDPQNELLSSPIRVDVSLLDPACTSTRLLLRSSEVRDVWRGQAPDARGRVYFSDVLLAHGLSVLTAESSEGPDGFVQEAARITVTVDVIAPTVTLSAPQPPPVGRVDEVPGTLSVTYDEAEVDSDRTLYIEDGLQAERSVSGIEQEAGEHEFSIPWDWIHDDARYVRVCIRDEAGNEGCDREPLVSDVGRPGAIGGLVVDTSQPTDITVRFRNPPEDEGIEASGPPTDYEIVLMADSWPQASAQWGTNLYSPLAEHRHTPRFGVGEEEVLSIAHLHALNQGGWLYMRAVDDISNKGPIAAVEIRPAWTLSTPPLSGAAPSNGGDVVPWGSIDTVPRISSLGDVDGTPGDEFLVTLEAQWVAPEVRSSGYLGRLTAQGELDIIRLLERPEMPPREPEVASPPAYAWWGASAVAGDVLAVLGLVGAPDEPRETVIALYGLDGFAPDAMPRAFVHLEGRRHQTISAHTEGDVIHLALGEGGLDIATALVSFPRPPVVGDPEWIQATITEVAGIGSQTALVVPGRDGVEAIAPQEDGEQTTLSAVSRRGDELAIRDVAPCDAFMPERRGTRFAVAGPLYAAAAGQLVGLISPLDGRAEGSHCLDLSALEVREGREGRTYSLVRQAIGLVPDLDADDQPELVAIVNDGPNHTRLAGFVPDGAEEPAYWFDLTDVGRMISQPASLGDIDNDGHAEIGFVYLPYQAGGDYSEAPARLGVLRFHPQ